VDSLTKGSGRGMRTALSIRVRLAVYISLIILIAVIATIVPAVYFFNGYSEKEHEEVVAQSLGGLQAALEEYKGRALNTAALFAEHPDVVNAVEAKDGAAILRGLTPLVKKTDLDFVTVTDEKGTVIIRTHEAKKGDSVMSQANIQAAVGGKSFAAIEPGTVVRLSIRAGVPVLNKQGKVVGVISAGYDATKDSIVDQHKKKFGTEATLFLGDERVATTVIKDGKRAVGTKLDEKIAAAVLGRGEKYIGYADILGVKHIAAYLPLMGPDNKPLGILFAGKSQANVLAERNKMFATLGMVIVVTLGIGIFAALGLARGIATPIKRLADGCRRGSIPSDFRE